ncbi:MAG: holo-ACP synthase [Longicatena sp.]
MMIGIGCDIVEIARIEAALRKDSFLNILTPKERMLFDALKGKRRIEFVAGRFAAKEAIYKAIHKEIKMELKDIEILSDASGAPICTILACHIEISIAHENAYAIAYALASKD